MTYKLPIIEVRESTKSEIAKVLPFVAWDGEGYTDEHGKHHYMLFGCSDGDYVQSDSLTHAQCFNLLLTVAARRKAIHVIFAGGYDMVMMIHNYPTHVAERILKGHVTWYGGYRHEYFKSKYLKLSDGSRSIILYDVFTFFSTSFVKACREYLGNDPDFDRIEATKLVRDSFTMDALHTEIIPYFKQELHYLVKLMNILRKRLIDADIPCRQWHGPGAVASTVLRTRGITAHMAHTPDEVKEAARHAYYGGRFEQHKIGYHDQPVYQYDIRSAYPHAITRLPSLAAITWRQLPVKRHGNANKRSFKPFGIYQVSYTAQASDGIDMAQPLPWRDTDKSIYYPPDINASWYWGIELQAALKYSVGSTIVIHDGWEPATDPVDYPFQWINTMYVDRARMKREGNPTQLALKLAMNSIYGKLAQSKGARLRLMPDTDEHEWQLPRYHQLEWAGWITAATRAKIYEAMTYAGFSLIAVETDAVYSTTPLPQLKVGEQLGDWDMDVAEAIMYVQSGVYFKKVDGSWKLKSRGFEPRNHTFENWLEVMKQLPHNTEATHKSVMRRFGTDPRSERFATWYEQQRESSIIAEQGKRVHRADHCTWCERGSSLATGFHNLVIPIDRINSATHSSTPHQLPWVNDGMRTWEDDFVVTEDGMYALAFGDDLA